MKTTLLILMILLSAALVFGTGEQEEASPTGQGGGDVRQGGTLIIALPGNPANLDMTRLSDPTVAGVMPYVVEGLFEYNAEGEPVPFLVQSYSVEDDGLAYRLKLRQGVQFHNGKEMTTEDVAASFDRWLKLNNGGKKVADFVTNVDIIGKYELVIRTSRTVGPMIPLLSCWIANQRMWVLPKEIVDAAGDGFITEFVGTGPYKFVEWARDQHIKLERFDDYVAHPDPSSGFAGKRIGYYDDIYIKFVPEQAVRVAGVQTGEYHFARYVPIDQFDIFDQNTETRPIYLDSYQQMIAFNCGTPPFNNVHARQAVAYGIDMDDLGRAMIGDERFWYAEDGSLFNKRTFWYDPEAGKGIYNVKDLDKAKKLLAKSGYDGTPIVILNGRESAVESKGAIALKAQLEKIGFAVDVQLLDRATVVEKRGKDEGWNIHLVYFSSVNPDPQVWSTWAGTNGWITNWDDEQSRETDELFARMYSETDQQMRKEIVKEWYRKFWETTPYIKSINWGAIDLERVEIQGGDKSKPLYKHFLNTWIEN